MVFVRRGEETVGQYLMATVEQTLLIPETRFVLSGISWNMYEMLRESEENQGVRMTYDDGTLELMSPSNDHEAIKKLIGRMIESFTEELGIAARSLGSSTWQGPERTKGLEADECYYILNHSLVRERRTIDLTVDPAPDLAIEVEVSRSAFERMKIYAALGVLEVWRWRRGDLSAWALEDEQYVEREFSLNLPLLRVKDLEPFLEFELADDKTAWIRNFRTWVRDHFLGERA